MTSTSAPFPGQQQIINSSQNYPVQTNNLQRPPTTTLQGRLGSSPNVYAQLPPNYHAPVFEGNPAIHSQVVASRILQPIYQLPGTTTSVRSRPAPTVVGTTPAVTQVRNVQPVQVSGMSRQSIPMSAIVNRVNPQQQQKVVEEVRIKRPVETIMLNQPPQVIETVKHEILNDPMIETAHQSTWNSYYQPKAAVSAPPSKSKTNEKSVCPLWLMALLGLLALGGLIAGIVLAARAASGYGSPPAGISETPGTGNTTTVPEASLYPNYTVTVETTVINTTAATTANTTLNQTATTNGTVAPVTKVINVDPVTVAPIVKTVDATIPADQTNATGTTSSTPTTVTFAPATTTTSMTTPTTTTTPQTTTTTDSKSVAYAPSSSGAQFSSNTTTTANSSATQVMKSLHRHMLKTAQ